MVGNKEENAALHRDEMARVAVESLSITASSPLGCNILLRTTQIFAETWRLESGVVSLVCQFVGDSK